MVKYLGPVFLFQQNATELDLRLETASHVDMCSDLKIITC